MRYSPCCHYYMILFLYVFKRSDELTSGRNLVGNLYGTGLIVQLKTPWSSPAMVLFPDRILDETSLYSQEAPGVRHSTLSLQCDWHESRKSKGLPRKVH